MVLLSRLLNAAGRRHGRAPAIEGPGSIIGPPRASARLTAAAPGGKGAGPWRTGEPDSPASPRPSGATGAGNCATCSAPRRTWPGWWSSPPRSGAASPGRPVSAWALPPPSWTGPPSVGACRWSRRPARPAPGGATPWGTGGAVGPSLQVPGRALLCRRPLLDLLPPPRTRRDLRPGGAFFQAALEAVGWVRTPQVRDMRSRAAIRWPRRRPAGVCSRSGPCRTSGSCASPPTCRSPAPPDPELARLLPAGPALRDPLATPRCRGRSPA
jgi:hypothetical protein